MGKIADRKIVVINQAVNYLTVDLCNAFYKRFENVTLITGNIHEQERKLNQNIKVEYITKWVAGPFKKKLISNLKASFEIFWLLKTKYKKHEVFFLSVPPMGYLVNLLIPNRFSMLIWDVFPDALKSSGIKESNPIYRFWSYLNKKSFTKAYRFYTISESMADLLSIYIPKKQQLITPIWSIFQSNKKISKENNPFVNAHKLQDKFVIQYSGNIGKSHRVENMIYLAEKLKDNDSVFFQIIGRGSRKDFLQKMVKEKKLKNCQFLPFQSDKMFPYSLSAADLGVVILDEIASKGSVPSKSYNLMSYGIPSLYISSEESELMRYSKKYNHAICLTENELDKAADFILKLANNHKIYKNFKENALKAAKDFKLENADYIVELYLKEK